MKIFKGTIHTDKETQVKMVETSTGVKVLLVFLDGTLVPDGRLGTFYHDKKGKAYFSKDSRGNSEYIRKN